MDMSENSSQDLPLFYPDSVTSKRRESDDSVPAAMMMQAAVPATLAILAVRPKGASSCSGRGSSSGSSRSSSGRGSISKADAQVDQISVGRMANGSEIAVKKNPELFLRLVLVVKRKVKLLVLVEALVPVRKSRLSVLFTKKSGL
jgi:hypothetical protein